MSKRFEVVAIALAILALEGTALADGSARLINVGFRSQPGISSKAQVFRQTSPRTVAQEQPVETAWSARGSGRATVPPPTNRCMATNMGGGFTYTFANGVECASFEPPVPDDPVRPTRRPRPPSPEEVAARLFDRTVALAPTPELEVAPSGVGLAGLRTFFWLDEAPEPIVATAAAGPATVTAVADPVQYLWDFGDGRDRLTETAGWSWSPRKRGSIGHVYQASGRYDLDVEVIWEARWRSGTGAWRPLGYFSTSDSRAYPVREVIAWLVRQW